jgi:hypothetical protein
MAMTETPLDRARQALEVSKARGVQPAALDRSKGDALLARARAAAESRPEPRPETRTAPPPSAVSTPRVERVRLQMSCSATGQPFVAIAERRGNLLLLAGHEPPRSGGGTDGPAEHLSGAYNLERGKGWACPHCGCRDDTWSCTCAAMPDSLHCGGQRGRLRYCACGRLEERKLIEVDSIEVRGQSMAATARSAPMSPSRGNLPALYPKR